MNMPINLILGSDQDLVRRHDGEEFSALHKQIRESIIGSLFKAKLQGEFRAHIFSDRGEDKRSENHQNIWLEGQEANSVILAAKPNGQKIYLVRLRVPKGDASDQRKFRSAIAHILKPKEPEIELPIPPPPPPVVPSLPAVAPPKPRVTAPTPVPPSAPLPSSPTAAPEKRAYHRQAPEEKKEEKKARGRNFSLKRWLAESANLVRVLVALHGFLEKMDQQRTTGKVLVGFLRNSGAMPENRSSKSFNLIGLLLEKKGYLEGIKSGREKYFRLTPSAIDLLREFLGKEGPPAFTKPPNPSEAVLERMRGQKVAETLELISVQTAKLAESYAQLAKLLGGKAG